MMSCLHSSLVPAFLLGIGVQAKTMGMKAGPASKLVVETLQLEGQLTAEQFLKDREVILHKTFSSAILMPGEPSRTLTSVPFAQVAARSVMWGPHVHGALM